MLPLYHLEFILHEVFCLCIFTVNSVLLLLSCLGFEGEIGPCHWTLERFNHVIHLREKAIKTARNMWADYLLVI